MHSYPTSDKFSLKKIDLRILHVEESFLCVFKQPPSPSEKDNYLKNLALNERKIVETEGD